MNIFRSFRVILPHLRPFAGVMLMAVGMMLVMSLVEGFGLGMLVPILTVMQDGDQGPGRDIFSQYSAAAISFLGLNYTFLTLVALFSAVMAVKFALQGLLDYIGRYLSSTVRYHLCGKIFGGMMRAPMSFFYQRTTGDMISTAHNSTIFAGSLADSSVRIVSGILSLVIYFGLQLIISVPLTLTALVLSGISYCFIVPRFRVAFDIGEDAKAVMDKIVSYLQQTISGMRTVKSFRREESHIEEFDGIIWSFRQMAIAVMRNKVIANLFIEPFSTALVVVLMVISVTVLKVPFAPLLTFFIVFSRLAPKFKQVYNEILEILQYLPHFIKVHEFIEATGVEVPERTGDPEIPSGAIRFEDVWFRYETREEPALAGVSIEIGENRTAALVGSSGAGKTTIADLLLRHQAPSRGRITVGGRDLQELDRGRWLERVGVVEQEPFLFNASVGDNIRYGKPDAGQEEVEAAARMANAHAFVMELPKGYETVVGDRGVALSGGQKQRIALARALIRDPKLLVLDEATSALDSASERLIQEAIGQFRGKKTILIIAHRLSTVADADQIILLEGGRIAEVGTHRSLLASGGAYSKNWHLQTVQARDRAEAAR
ncbi:MAG: ABC transporter ATP-binding protein [Candidatus Tectomicrobia bacterium]|uniref:ABC transporter ATP-binding protein n=1 Tax=Tectimicrobiota bacterium TaxID=2528274 RepID=A0A932MNB7_UNCTE|nr:ABC transporter ATP-binding protein [Candidatus Tectomicrobia bacterium]